ncbi:DUF3298 and DUF4163 domain-containing protein [Pseudochryseolinea flava]|uniref:DUF3298 domain-containing protein n=1 Tax=Pseudochryseolinea flava TaxID=2059302 RepID=A0A364XUG3_9BACT|nr:DUF3298 and DUF4163 domain-containing protein [Pseudochryseolinea flava]RAV97947.1 hypothetical protein DQQ10_26105 [Pseudochryseolinea flava]
MKYPLRAFVLALAVMSCTNKKVSGPALNIKTTMKVFEFASTPQQEDTTVVASYKVTYPVFEGVDENVANKITFKIDSLLTQGYSEAMPLTIQQASQAFVHQFEEYQMEDPTSKQRWYFSGIVGVNIVSDTLISLAIFRDEYTGGGHPNTRTDFLNIDPHTGDDILLAHELEEGFEAPLTVVGEKVFRTVRQIPDSSSLSNSYFEFPQDKFRLTKTYGFTKKGILFFYNNYEIAPYAIGPTEVLVPYSEIKDWLR